jgi:osmotically-inducible protein OsmY
VRHRTDAAHLFFYSPFISPQRPRNGLTTDLYFVLLTCKSNWRFNMHIRTTLAATMTAIVLLTAQGCAVTRGQESVGAYVDDATITTQVKSRFVENKQVDAAAISVETMKGTVMLSGFAKNATEKVTAETIARGVKGVVSVKNEIAIRP